jgi:hypothetical protein
MTEWEVTVRIVAEVRYMRPPASQHEAMLQRQAQHRIQAMAAALEKQVQQQLAEQITAEIDLARPTPRRTGEPNG